MESVMKTGGTKTLIVFILFAFCITVAAKKKDHDEAKSRAAFAAPYTKVVRGAERFENANYFSLMASDGIRKIDAKVVYARLQAAVAADERYKALYLARILTELKRDNPAVWTNRAQLASALGLVGEATACESNAKNPSQPVSVSLADILPGTALKIKPTTLSDWAAATALLSDGMAEKDGKQALVSFKDMVSGIHEATEKEIADRNESFQQNGLNPPGPWAIPEPVQLRHVLANAFELRSAEPMHNHSTSNGGMFAAMMMAGLSGMQQNTNPTLARQTMDAAQQMAGRASEVPSHYKGGSYTRVAFDDGKEVITPDHPQTSGEFETVREPVPFLWASGGSMEPYFFGYWKTTQSTKVRKITIANLDDVNNAHAKRYSPPTELAFPKLAKLCIVRGPEDKVCSSPLSLMELLLTRDDVGTLAPALSADLVNLDGYRQSYDSAILVLEPSNGDGQYMWGVDDNGALFQLSPSATSWLIPAH
jgi:hypothetical protein